MKKSNKVLLILGIVLVISSSGLFFFSFSTYQVKSESMSPAMTIGDLLIIRAEEPENIEVGDIILFFPQWAISFEFIAHRVIDMVQEDVDGIIKWKFQTQGDNNPSPDPYWTYEDYILGVVSKISPRLGWIKPFSRIYFYSSLGLSGVFGIIMLIGYYVKSKKR